MSPLSRLYTPSPLTFDAGSSAYAPFHQSESSLNSKLPVSAFTSAAGGRNGYASMLSAATCTSRFLYCGSEIRASGTLAFTLASSTTFWNPPATLMIFNREPPLRASFTTLSRTRADSPRLGSHGERTTTSPSIIVAFVNFTHEPHPGIVSTGPVGFVCGHNFR